MNIYRRIMQAAAGLALVAGQAAVAQVQTIDPNSAIDGDLSHGAAAAPANPATASSGTYATPVGPEVGTTPALPAPSQTQSLPPSTVDQSLPATTTAAPVPPPPSPIFLFAQRLLVCQYLCNVFESGASNSRKMLRAPMSFMGLQLQLP